MNISHVFAPSPMMTTGLILFAAGFLLTLFAFFLFISTRARLRRSILVLCAGVSIMLTSLAMIDGGREPSFQEAADVLSEYEIHLDGEDAFHTLRRAAQSPQSAIMMKRNGSDAPVKLFVDRERLDIYRDGGDTGLIRVIPGK